MSKRPHIVIDALLVRKNPTGVGRSILELTDAMSQKDWGFDFTVLSSSPDMFSKLQGQTHWRVADVPGSRGGNLKKSIFTQFGLGKLLKELNADILHSMQFVAPMFVPCHSVVTVHDLAWLLYPKTVEEPRRSYYKFFVPRTLSKASAIVTNSQATYLDVCREYPQVAESVHVTPFGTPSWVWQQPEVTETADKPYFLFVGTLEPRKNLPALLAAYEMYIAEHQGGLENTLNLVLVGGKGWSDSPLQGPFKRLQRQGKLKIRDYCGLSELWEHYNKATALLFPSLHEGFGFPILEAMAAGLPVLTANRGAMAEVAGQAAALVNPDDVTEMSLTMAKMAHDQQWRNSFAQSGPPRAAFWSWEETARRTISVYKEVLASSSGAINKS